MTNKKDRLKIMTLGAGDSIMIGGEVHITVVIKRFNRVKLAIRAPENINVHRKEVYLRINFEKNEDS